MSERRRCGRRPAVRLKSVLTGLIWRAAIHDVSEQGLGLISPRRLELGAVLLIQVEDPDVGFKGTMTGQVRHATRQSDGSWRVGCRLLQPLTKFQLFALL